MKVIISGGGIAGLTLANALERAGIDFLLLETRSLFDPQVGASIAIGPGAMRVFDQIGAAPEILGQTSPILKVFHHNPDGSLIMPPDNTPQLLDARLSYPTSFLDRQLVLRALERTITQKDKMLLNKRVSAVGHTDDGVTVHCEDGSSYDGDLVIGCDGVHSKVRAEMWRIGTKVDPDSFPPREQTKMTAEYRCLFGISTKIAGMEIGDLRYMYDKDRSFLVFVGKDGRIFWFFFEKLDRKYHYHAEDFPRYSQADAEQVAMENGHRRFHDSLTLSDIWKTRVSYTLVPMEEALFEKWSWGRIATIGDNTHKMTANHGQAGQNAIESAVALANQLQRLSKKQKLTMTDYRNAMEAWQLKRKDRITANWQAAADVCRMQSLAGLKERIMVYAVMPNAAALLVGMFTDALIGSEILEYLPFPEQSFRGSCPFNPKAGVGFKESPVVRAARSAPLLMITGALLYMSPRSGDNISTLVYSSISQANADSMMTSFLSDTTTLYALWFIESVRRANSATPLQLFTIWASLAQYFGIGHIAPVFFFVHYVLSSLEAYGPKDLRMANVAYARTFLPIVLPIISALVFFKPSSISLQAVEYTWLLLPAGFSTLQYLLIKGGLSRDNEKKDAMTHITRDLKHTVTSVILLSLLSATQWLRLLLAGEMWHMLQVLLNHNVDMSVIAIGYEHAAAAVSALLWMGLLYRDTHMRRMDTSNVMLQLLAAIVLTIMIGPVATVGCAWIWREDVLTTRYDQHAIIKERHSGLTMMEVYKLEEKI